MKEPGTTLLPHDHGHGDAHLAPVPSIETFDRVAETFSLVSDSTRLRILWLLCQREECVCNIAAAVNMSASAVSHHLRVLRQAGLISGRRDGKETHYSLADTEGANLVHSMIRESLHLEEQG